MDAGEGLVDSLVVGLGLADALGVVETVAETLTVLEGIGDSEGVLLIVVLALEEPEADNVGEGEADTL